MTGQEARPIARTASCRCSVSPMAVRGEATLLAVRLGKVVGSALSGRCPLLAGGEPCGAAGAAAGSEA